MMAPAIVTDSKQTSLLREAAEWRLTGLLLECPTEGWPEQVSALAAEVEDADLKAAAEAARQEATEGLYHSIFGPGGPAPAREVSYRELIQPGYLLAELAACYEAFSYTAAVREAADHISVEAGFIGYLRLKEAYALACGDVAHAEITAEAAQAFIDEHIAAMAEPMANDLAASGICYLAFAGAALLGRVGPRRKRPTGQGLPVLSDIEERAFECGEI